MSEEMSARDFAVRMYRDLKGLGHFVKHHPRHALGCLGEAVVSLAAFTGYFIIIGLIALNVTRCSVSRAAEPPQSQGAQQRAPQQLPLPQANGAGDGLFRSMRWGFSPALVSRQERRGDVIVSPGGVSQTFDCYPKIGGHACKYFFFFGQPGGPHSPYRLNAGVYQFTASYGTSYWKYVDRWRDIQALLVKRYGAPKEMSERWHDPTLKDDRGSFAIALVGGSVTLRSVWYTKSSKIIHEVRSQHFYPAHTIMYLPLEPEPNKGDGSDQL